MYIRYDIRLLSPDATIITGYEYLGTDFVSAVTSSLVVAATGTVSSLDTHGGSVLKYYKSSTQTEFSTAIGVRLAADCTSVSLCDIVVSTNVFDPVGIARAGSSRNMIEK